MKRIPDITKLKYIYPVMAGRHFPAFIDEIHTLFNNQMFRENNLRIYKGLKACQTWRLFLTDEIHALNDCLQVNRR